MEKNPLQRKNFLWNSNFESYYSNKFLKKIWPLFGLFETAYGQIWPFYFFWTWQPWLNQQLIQKLRTWPNVDSPQMFHKWNNNFSLSQNKIAARIIKMLTKYNEMNASFKKSLFTSIVRIYRTFSSNTFKKQLKIGLWNLTLCHLKIRHLYFLILKYLKAS